LGCEGNTLGREEIFIENSEEKLHNKENFLDKLKLMKGNKWKLSGISWLRIMAGSVVM
jgi:hypothetical protein